MTPRFIFLSERTFESWDWTNPERRGIGGSETSHIEMAQRLQRRGHECISFAPVDWAHGYVTDPAGVFWTAIENLDASATLELARAKGAESADVWVIYRAPHLVDLLPAGAIAWLICQDVDYTSAANLLDEARALRFTRIVALCHAQAAYLRRRLPAAADRVVQSSNGIRGDVVAAFDSSEDSAGGGPPKRNPLRMMYASSPDRGLEFLLPIFERVKEIVPDAELHVCYGFDNIDKVIKYSPAGALVAAQKQKLVDTMKRLGVVHHGRMGQGELMREWFKSAVWCHPSNFTETSCITCMDAQACGAVPVTSPIWAIAENVQHGVFIEGDVRDTLVRARYVREVAELLLNPDMADAHRFSMMPWARHFFDWERFVDQWQEWAAADVALPRAIAVSNTVATALEDNLKTFTDAGVPA